MFFKKLNLEDLDFPKEIEINSKKFQIKVNLFNKRSSSIIVKEDLLDIRLSSYLKKQDAQNHINSLLKQMSLKLQKKQDINILNFKDAIKRGYFYINSTQFKLEKTNKNRFLLKKNIFYLPMNQDFEILEKKIIFKLCQYFQKDIENIVNNYNNKTYGFKFGKILVKLVNSKWGHCTSKNDLLFNIKLLNVPKEVFEYVIAHELSHIKHKNHSKLFWNEVSKHCPNYLILRKYLKDNFISLFNDKPIQ